MIWLTRSCDLPSYVLVLVLVACGSHNPPTNTAVDGASGFVPTSTMMLQAPVGCTVSGLMTNGDLDALTVIIADADLVSGDCGSASVPAPHVLLLQIATGGYFTADPNAANEPIIAGTTFSILDENVTDEDLCGNVPGDTTQPTGIAILEECPVADMCTAQYWATSGSLTVTSVSPSAIEGTFDLVLGDTSGVSIGGQLTGQFSADTCP